ncbi:MAG: hypothetical protein H3Z51_14290, partial [archaeon]|nr:hypothetical protein [archaeon]
MVTAGKVFVVKEEIDIDAIASKLKDFKTEEIQKFDDRELKLITEINDVKMVT